MLVASQLRVRNRLRKLANRGIGAVFNSVFEVDGKTGAL